MLKLVSLRTKSSSKPERSIDILGSTELETKHWVYYLQNNDRRNYILPLLLWLMKTHVLTAWTFNTSLVILHPKETLPIEPNVSWNIQFCIKSCIAQGLRATNPQAIFLMLRYEFTDAVKKLCQYTPDSSDPPKQMILDHLEMIFRMFSGLWRTAVMKIRSSRPKWPTMQTK